MVGDVDQEPNPDFLELAHQRLAGEETTEGRQQLDALLAEPANLERFRQLEQLWNRSSRLTPSSGFRQSEAWTRISREINPPAKESTPDYSYPQPEPTPFPFRWLVGAAGLAAALAVGFLTWTQLGPTTEMAPSVADRTGWREIANRGDQRLTATLPDQSRVVLNANTTLAYAPDFGASTRQVELEGEAFFDIARREDAPFIVRAGVIRTTVLGTQFNVRARPNTTQHTVSLVEGSVRVDLGSPAPGGSGILLQPNQSLQFDVATRSSRIAKFDATSALAWLTESLRFDDAPLREVAATLESRFGVILHLGSPELGDLSVQAHFESEDLWEILDVVTVITGNAYAVSTRPGERTEIILRPAHE